MPNARKRHRHSIVVLATSNMDSWLHTPRTIVMLVAAVLLCFVETQKLFRNYSIEGYSLNMAESIFLLAYTGFNILMSSMMFLVTISELPKQISFQYYSLVRVTRRKWLNSQVLYCLSMVLIFLLLLLACSFIFCIGGAAWQTDWSPLMTNGVPGVYAFLSNFLTESFSPLGALAMALLPVAGMWFTLSMFLLFMSLFGYAKLGLMISAFALIIDYISIQSSLPVSPMQYATLLSIDNSGNFIGAFVTMISVYVVLNALLYAAMCYKVSRMDLHFNSQKTFS
ncbi:MAG: hypothetical protein RSE58_13060 [Clostridia bacterium]